MEGARINDPDIVNYGYINYRFIHQEVYEAVYERMESITGEEIREMMQHRMESLLRHQQNQDCAELREILESQAQRTGVRLQELLRHVENKLAKRIRAEMLAMETRIRNQASRKKRKGNKEILGCLNPQMSKTSRTKMPNSLEQLNLHVKKLEQVVDKTLNTVFPQVDALLTHLERHPQFSIESANRPPSTHTGPSTSASNSPSSLQPARFTGTEPSFDSLTLPIDAPERAGALARDLLQAIRGEKIHDVRRLLEAGANADFSEIDGWSCLIWAAQNANADIISMLLEKGADFNATNSEGHTALHFASLNDYSGRCVSLLIDAGADVDKRNNDGDTPLHFAANCANEVGASKLIAAGASKTIKNSAGKTPFSILSGVNLYQLLRPSKN